MTELPAGWALRPLGELADTQLGKMLDSARQIEGGNEQYLRNVNVRWGSFDLSDVKTMRLTPSDREKFSISAGDLVVCEGGEPGRCAIWRGPGNIAFQKSLHRIRPGSGVDSLFLRYYLEAAAITGDLSSHFTGVTIAHLPQERLRRLPVPLPPLDEQRRIVARLEDHLSRLDAAVQSLSTIATRSKVLIASALAQWLSPTSRWTRSTLGEVAAWGSGGTPKAGTEAYYGGDIPWAVIGDLNDGVVATTASTITNRGLAESSAKWVPPGSVLIAMYGSIGKLGLPEIAMATNQAIAFATPHPDILDRRFLFWFLRSQRSRLSRAGKGATQQNISQTILKGWPIAFPSLPQQTALVESIDGLRASLSPALDASNNAAARAAALRRSLLAAAFSGRL